jgi:hypothetical protein
MPQFDKITFFNQIFWLVLIFFSFYIFLLKNYLPRISSVLKTRSKKLLKTESAVSHLKDEEVSTLADSNRVLVGVSLVCRTNLSLGIEKSNSWLESSNTEPEANSSRKT